MLPRYGRVSSLRNFTGPESRIMPGPGGRDFLQGYNCQAVVDSAHQVIVAARATYQASDNQQAVGMIEEAIDNAGGNCSRLRGRKRFAVEIPCLVVPPQEAE